MGGTTEFSIILRQLGSTATEIAASLKANGTHGVRNTKRFLNPIVRYVQERAGAETLSVDVIQPETLHVTFRDGKSEVLPLPAAVMAFLEAFNRGEYPELEMP